MCCMGRCVACVGHAACFAHTGALSLKMYKICRSVRSYMCRQGVRAVVCRCGNNGSKVNFQLLLHCYHPNLLRCAVSAQCHFEIPETVHIVHLPPASGMQRAFTILSNTLQQLRKFKSQFYLLYCCVSSWMNVCTATFLEVCWNF